MAHAILSATGLLDEKIRPEFKKSLKIYAKKLYPAFRYFTLSGLAAMNFSQDEDDLSPASGFVIW